MTILRWTTGTFALWLILRWCWCWWLGLGLLFPSSSRAWALKFIVSLMLGIRNSPLSFDFSHTWFPAAIGHVEARGGGVHYWFSSCLACWNVWQDEFEFYSTDLNVATTDKWNHSPLCMPLFINKSAISPKNFKLEKVLIKTESYPKVFSRDVFEGAILIYWRAYRYQWYDVR